MSNKAFPADWDSTPLPRGVTKNPAQRCYNVRISVAGKQLHVATSSSQAVAATLYDLALWKLCPKMTKRPEPNNSEAFSFITQHGIDQDLPRLNKLYARLPFVLSGDELENEETLRELALIGRLDDSGRDAEMHDYDKTIEFLRRAVVELADLEAKFHNRTAKLTKLHKLACSEHLRGGLTEKLAFVRIDFNALRDSLESQRAYYQKLIDTQP